MDINTVAINDDNPTYKPNVDKHQCYPFAKWAWGKKGLLSELGSVRLNLTDILSHFVLSFDIEYKHEVYSLYL